MSGFLDMLSAGFGAPVDRVGAGLEGGLVSAKTQDALMQARERRATARMAERQDAEREMLRENAAANGGLPSVVAMLAADVGGNYEQLQGGEAIRQQMGFRSLLADPTADPAAALAAGQGVQGRVLPKIDALGAGRELDLITQQASTNDIGQAQIRNYAEQGGGGTLRNLSPDEVASFGYAPNTVVQVDAHGRQTVKQRPPSAASTVPARIRQAAAANAALLANIDSALAAVELYPGAFGLQNVLGDAVNQRVDPEGVSARAAVGDISSAKMHDRSGAAITAREFPRLRGFIPSENDRADAILVKLGRMRAALQEEQEALLAGASVSPAGGAAPVAPSAAAVSALSSEEQAELDALRQRFGRR